MMWWKSKLLEKITIYQQCSNKMFPEESMFTNADLLLGQRCRRWSNIKIAVVKCRANWASIINDTMFVRSYVSSVDDGTTLKKHCVIYQSSKALGWIPDRCPWCCPIHFRPSCSPSTPCWLQSDTFCILQCTNRQLFTPRHHLTYYLIISRGGIFN